MVKKIRFFILIIRFFILINLIFNICIGQGITNHWELGYNSSLAFPWGGIDVNFSNGLPDTSRISRTMEFYITNGVASDSTGNLKFYTNGTSIADANNNTMQNGNGLNPGQFANNYLDGMPIIQGNIVLQFPDNINIYYLFHETCTLNGSILQPSELFYSVIDMTLNGGLGGVTIKNTIILQDTLDRGELCATRHANGRDWWLVFHKYKSDLFYKQLVTPSGITTFFQNCGPVNTDYIDASIFSPDGTKFAHYSVFAGVDLYDFDRCTGMLSNYISLPISDSAIAGSVTFSSNSHVLYAASGLHVYQFDITSPNISSTMQTIGVWDGNFSPGPPFATNFFLSLLGPDGKIYINSTNSVLQMHVINYPDSIGLACDLQQHSFNLPAYNFCTLPNFPNYSLGREIGSPCDSLTAVPEQTTNTIPIRIKPNPAQNTFYLNYKLPYGITAVATVFNTLGEAVIKRNLYWYFGYLQIDCSGLEAGVYIVQIDAKGMLGSAKLVIVKN